MYRSGHSDLALRGICPGSSFSGLVQHPVDGSAMKRACHRADPIGGQQHNPSPPHMLPRIACRPDHGFKSLLVARPSPTAMPFPTQPDSHAREPAGIVRHSAHRFAPPGHTPRRGPRQSPCHMLDKPGPAQKGFVRCSSGYSPRLSSSAATRVLGQGWHAAVGRRRPRTEPDLPRGRNVSGSAT
jgi:hypothetical protein